MKPGNNDAENQDPTGKVFSWSRGVIWWLVVVTAMGITLVLAEGSENLFPGVWLLFVGAGLIGLGNLFGSARTGSWFTRDEPVRPTWFEAIIGLTGVMLAACPLIVILIRFAAAYLKQKYV